MIRVIPNYCATCGHEISDNLTYRLINIEESPKKARVPICPKCKNDLYIHSATEVEE